MRISCARIAMLSAVALGAIVSLSVSADAAFVSGLISLDFNTTSGGTPINASGAGVIGAAGDKWNNINITGAGTGLSASNLALVDSSNASTDATLSYSGTGGYRTNNNQKSPINESLFDSWLSVNGSTHGTITLGGLSAAVEYDLYVYSQSDKAGRAVALTVTGGGAAQTGTITNTTNGGATAYTSGGNYLKFTLKPDNTGKIGIDFVKAGTDPQKEGDINGIQITPVPEPASVSVLGLGGLALLRRRRKARA